MARRRALMPWHHPHPLASSLSRGIIPIPSPGWVLGYSGPRGWLLHRFPWQWHTEGAELAACRSPPSRVARCQTSCAFQAASSFSFFPPG